MVNTANCALLSDHCNHWGLTDAQHAIAHVMARRTDEVYQQDVVVEGRQIGDSSSSLADDGPAIERLLADEGYAVVPVVLG